MHLDICMLLVYYLIRIKLNNCSQIQKIGIYFIFILYHSSPSKPRKKTVASTINEPSTINKPNQNIYTSKYCNTYRATK